MRHILLISFIAVATVLPLHAQDASFVMDLDQKVTRLENDLKDYYDVVETLKHEVKTLKAQVEELKSAKPEGGETSSVDVAAQSQSKASPQEAYEKARGHLERADYESAEKGFADFVSQFPKDENASNAQYWLGVTFFVRGQHDKAVAAFAKGLRDYPKAAKSPDMMMKMAKSLVGLNRTADACTTLQQMAANFPDTYKAEREAELKSLSCLKD